MLSIDLKSLIGRLNPVCRRALEGAAGLCNSRTNYNIELEHWLLKLLEVEHTDLLAVLQHFDVDPSELQRQLLRAMDKLKTGSARDPALSQTVVDTAKNAWMLASLDHGLPAVRSGHVLLAMMLEESIWRVTAPQLDSLSSVSLEELRKDYLKICADTSEDVAVSAGAKGELPRGGRGRSTQALDQFTIDLTARARDGKIDPVLGRDEEIRQIIDILLRRRQNNPILTGEAGVGKTAVVEGFALRIASGDVPDPLKNVSIHSLDLALLQAGAGVKGEFENRLKSVIEEVSSSPAPIVLFIDEAHTLVGAGGQAGQGDAANLLKPALARGELRTVAATTWAEYKKYFEKDAALARRFQVIRVEEPGEASAIDMMRGLVDKLEGHHGVRILNEAVEDAVRLSSRYLTGRQLPDKAVSVLDTACAKIALSQSSKPAAVEDCERRLEHLERSANMLRRESIAGVDFSNRIREIEEEEVRINERLAALRERWTEETKLAQRIQELLQQLQAGHTALDAAIAADASASGDTPETAEGEPNVAADADASTQPDAPSDDRQALESELESTHRNWRKVSGESPLVYPFCDSNAVASTIASWTGIPVGRMVSDEIRTILNLQESLEKSVVGQSYALEQIAHSIQTSRARLTDPTRPIGVFLLVGTSGVGKTETGITLAELLYGGEQNMTVLNMSEFKEEHKVSLLMGSPPGYVGYGEGGVMTEAVRRKPYSVLLLDEMEKAHPGVQDIFYQVFDKGHMKDGEGRDIDFKNTVIIMTSNAGSDLIKSLCSDPETMPEPEAFLSAVYPELLKTFKPAFLGRVAILPFYPLPDDVMRKIVGLKLGKVKKRVRENYGANFTYGEDVVDSIVGRCTEVDTGARNVDKILNKNLLPALSAECLMFLSEGKEIGNIGVLLDESGNFRYEISEKP